MKIELRRDHLYSKTMGMRIGWLFVLAAALGAVAACAGVGDETSSPGVDAGGAGGTGGTGPIDPVTGAGLPLAFSWSSTVPLVAPAPDAAHPIVAVKEPTVVYFSGRWHLFATAASASGGASIVYLSFAQWSDAATAQPFYLDTNPALGGGHSAPQVFYFAPQSKWYLVYQAGAPQYSTTDDISKPATWSQPTSFFADAAPGAPARKWMSSWASFFVICDDARCHLFFTDADGELYRSDTDVGSFPLGFGDPTPAIQGTADTVVGSAAVYRLMGRSEYLALVAALGPTGNRYTRSFVASSLEGQWVPLADSWNNPFAGKLNVTFDGGNAWTGDISDGELLRDGYDQSLEIDTANLRFVYQGVDRLGLLTRTP